MPPPDLPSSLGRAIRQERQRARWSQTELAARLRVSQGTISFWERDVEAPSLDHLVKLLAALPGLAQQIRARNFPVVGQVRQIERALFAGGCGCEDCRCGGDEAPKGRVFTH